MIGTYFTSHNIDVGVKEQQCVYTSPSQNVDYMIAACYAVAVMVQGKSGCS